METQDKKDVQKMIDLQSKKDFRKRIGDTPTDALQLVNKKYVDSSKKVFGGAVDSTGVAIALPPGWTSIKNSTGDYTVTHNLATTAYIVVACIGIGVRFLALSTQLSNTFGINTYNNTNTLADGPFNFILTLTS